MNITNPYLVKDDDSIEITSISAEERDSLIEQGYDGLLFEDPEFRYEEIVVFYPDQVAFAAEETPETTAPSSVEGDDKSTEANERVIGKSKVSAGRAQKLTDRR